MAFGGQDSFISASSDLGLVESMRGRSEKDRRIKKVVSYEEVTLNTSNSWILRQAILTLIYISIQLLHTLWIRCQC